MNPRIELICPGKTKEAWLNAALAEYETRIGHFCKFKLRILKDHGKLPPAKCVERESERILEAIGRNGSPILLEAGGKPRSSENFAAMLADRLEGGSGLIFVIGGAYGVSPAVRERSRERLSLSSMTFTHQIARLIFLEQLYRAFTLIHRIPYHH